MAAAKTSLGFLALHAASGPDSPAVDIKGLRVTWQRFHDDAKRCHALLARMGVQAGQLVAVQHSNPYVLWLLLVGLEELGAVSSVFQAKDLKDRSASGFADMQGLSALTISEEQAEGGAWHRIDAAWLEELFKGQVVEPPASALDEKRTIRLIRTSGTTGKSKLLALDARGWNFWVEQVQRVECFDKESVFLAAYPFTVNAVHSRAAACLRQGARMVFDVPARCLAPGEVTHLWMLPGNLMQVLAKGPKDAKSNPGLRLTTGGAPVSFELRRMARGVLGVEIQEAYGANEVGSAICLIDADGVGRSCPDVDLRIADENGRDVALGDKGRMWLRSPALAKGYLNDEAATKRHFKDGWFLSDDLATRLSDQRFRIIGRLDGMLNLAGVKMAADSFEEALLKAVPDVQEIAAAMSNDPETGPRLDLLAVCREGTDRDAAARKLLVQLSRFATGVRLKLVDVLPRTDSGKPRRAAIAGYFEKPENHGED